MQERAVAVCDCAGIVASGGELRCSTTVSGELDYSRKYIHAPPTRSPPSADPWKPQNLEAYASALRGYFRKRAASAEVDDLIQDTFLNMHARRATTHIENLRGYLFSVASHVLHRHRVRIRRHAELLSDQDVSELEHEAAHAPSAEEEVLTQERLLRLIRALDGLSPRTRDVFLLHRFEEMSYDAIAVHLNVSVSAIEKHIMNALKVIRSEVDSSPTHSRTERSAA